MKNKITKEELKSIQRTAINLISYQYWIIRKPKAWITS